MRGDFAAGARALEDWLAKNPDDFQAMLQLADAARGYGHLALSYRQARRALDASHLDPMAACGYAQTLTTLGFYTLATRWLDTVDSELPRSACVTGIRGGIAYQQGDFREMLHLFKGRVIGDPNFDAMDQASAQSWLYLSGAKILAGEVRAGALLLENVLLKHGVIRSPAKQLLFVGLLMSAYDQLEDSSSLQAWSERAEKIYQSAWLAGISSPAMHTAAAGYLAQQHKLDEAMAELRLARASGELEHWTYRQFPQFKPLLERAEARKILDDMQSDLALAAASLRTQIDTDARDLLPVNSGQ